ncbi:uncharacterized protein [Struthio camelus]|uniref:uncharacterized protein n=1 Tax=Struthio camelus TaxID=8801 RepID=UPI003603D190
MKFLASLCTLSRLAGAQSRGQGSPAGRAAQARSGPGATATAMLSKASTLRKVLWELLSMLEERPLRKPFLTTRDSTRVLALAATRALCELLQQCSRSQEVKAFFSRLCLALLFQIAFTAELTPQDLAVFRRQCHRWDPCTPTSPVSSAVQTLESLFCCAGYEHQALLIRQQGGWHMLLSAETLHLGVIVVARELRKSPAPEQRWMLNQLVALLEREDEFREIPAMAFFSELLMCADLRKVEERVLNLLQRYVRHHSAVMRWLVLRGLLPVSERATMVSRGEPGKAVQERGGGQKARGKAVSWALLGPGRCGGCAAPGERHPCPPERAPRAGPACPSSFGQSFSQPSLSWLHQKHAGCVTQARKMHLLLPDLMKCLQDADRDIRLKALMVLRNVFSYTDRQRAQPTTLQLMEMLLPLFDDEASQLRQLSILLFKDVMETVGWSDKWRMKQEVQRSLLPLFFHMSDERRRVAQVGISAGSRDPGKATTLAAGSPWLGLSGVGLSGNPPASSTTSAVGAAPAPGQNRADGEDQRVHAGPVQEQGRGLRGPEPTVPAGPPGIVARGGREVHRLLGALFGGTHPGWVLRCAARGSALPRGRRARGQAGRASGSCAAESTRRSVSRDGCVCLGLAARHMRPRSEEKLQAVRKALQPLQNDSHPCVSALATQTILMLRPPQENSPSAFSLRALRSRLRRSWGRWHVLLGCCSVGAELEQQC